MSRNRTSICSGAATPAQWVLWAPTPSKTMKAWRLMIWVQTPIISCTTCYYNTYFSRCILLAQPAMPLLSKKCEVLTRWDRVSFPCIKSIDKLIWIFHSENLINSSYTTIAWRDQVLKTSFSSFLSEIQFCSVCKIGWQKYWQTKTAQKDTWGIVILFLLNNFDEKSSLISLVI